jgi:ATP-dependent DNA helicase PIF1
MTEQAINVVENNGDVDEIKEYIDSRWVTPPEALWRIYGFDISEIFPSVKLLQLHLPNMHMVSYPEEANLNDVNV